MCIRCKIETVSFYVLDFRLASVDFAVAYEHILSLLVQQGIKVNFIEKQVVYLMEPLTVAELTFSMTGLSGLCSLELAEELSDFAESANDYQCKVTEKPIGYQIRFRLPTDLSLDFNDFGTDLHLYQEDFITDSVNPVVCTPADFNPRGSLTKAFLREYKAQQELFNQKVGPGGVARIKPMTNRTGTFLFFCVTRMTMKERIAPEVFYNCLLSLRDMAFRENINILSFPLIDWEREFLSFEQFCQLLDMIFTRTGIEIRLYPYYFLSIK